MSEIAKPRLGDFVACGTDIGHVLGVYTDKIDEATGVMWLFAEYEDNGYTYQWERVNIVWDDVPFTNMLEIAHPRNGFYAEGIRQYTAYCERRHPRMGKWMTPANTRRWLHAGIKRAGQRHVMAANLAESTN